MSKIVMGSLVLHVKLDLMSCVEAHHDITDSNLAVGQPVVPV